MPVKILFDGAYGISSFGDDAPLIVLTESLRERLGEVEFAVVSRHANEQLYSSYGVRAVEGLEYPTKEESMGKWFRGFNQGDDREELCRLYDEVASSNLLVLGAGNFLLDLTIDLFKGPVPRFLVMSLMAKMTGTPIMWYGISVGPLKTRLGRDMSRMAASLATHITVRDERSLLELAQLGLSTVNARQLPDPVLGMDLPAVGAARQNSTWCLAHAGGRPVFAVSLRYIPGSCGLSNESYLQEMAKILDQIIVKYGANILFIPQCIYSQATPDQDDRNTSRQLMRLMKQEKQAFAVEDELNVHQCAALYQGAHAAICTRLHGCVFAVMNGVPTVAICYHAKVKEFMDWLDLAEFSLPIADLTESAVIAKVENLLQTPMAFLAKSAAKIKSSRPLLDEYTNIAITAVQGKTWFPC